MWSGAAFLPAGPRREGVQHRRQHQHQCRRDAGGKVRRHPRLCEGTEVVLADGTVLQLGGKQVKDASGLSLKHLLIGSEGTLAVLTKCAAAAAKAGDCRQRSGSLSRSEYRYPERADNSACECEPHRSGVHGAEGQALGEDFSGVRYPRPDAGSYILLTFDGHQGEVEANAARCVSWHWKTARWITSYSPTRHRRRTSGRSGAHWSKR